MYFFLFAIRKETVNTVDKISATTTQNQIAFAPKIRGRARINTTWKTSVLKNEIIAEITPLFSAVKNDEPKMLNPANR